MNETFAMRIKQYRKEHFMTQRQLADLVGISVNYIGTLEKGKKRPRASTIATFEEAVQRREAERRILEKWELRDEDDRVSYMRLVRALKRFEPEKVDEILELFHCILDCAEE